MRRLVFSAALALAAFGSYFLWRFIDRVPVETISFATAIPPEAAPMCPWRDPELDMESFFPRATSYQTETRILSGLRAELAERLYRQPTGDENALRLNRVYQGSTSLGVILTRRVKGEFGGIELVLAIDNDGAVRGLRLQRLREPESTAAALQDTNWLGGFAGKRVSDSWIIGGAIPQLPAGARESAAAIVDGVHSLLVLNDAAEDAPTPRLAQTHHH
jgi:hypothetical protein